MRCWNKILALLTAAVLLLALLPAASADGLTITTQSQVVEAGAAPGEVRVELTMSGNPGLLGGLLTIRYSEGLTLKSVQNGAALTGMEFTPPGDLAANPFKVMWTSRDEVRGDGTLLTLVFDVPEGENTYTIEPSCDPDDFFRGTPTCGMDFEDVPVTLLPGTVTVKTAVSAFQDVDRFDWYRAAVDYVVQKGVMSGYSADTFGPGNELTRAMVVQVLYNKEGKPGSDAPSPFSDVPADQWYHNAVRWGAAKNVVAGYGGGVFKPDDSVTLEQVAVILHNYSGKPAGSGDISALGEHSDWAEPALRWAAEKGVFEGMPAFTVTGPATRAQTAQMLMNYLK